MKKKIGEIILGIGMTLVGILLLIVLLTFSIFAIAAALLLRFILHRFHKPELAEDVFFTIREWTLFSTDGPV